MVAKKNNHKNRSSWIQSNSLKKELDKLLWWDATINGILDCWPPLGVEVPSKQNTNQKAWNHPITTAWGSMQN